MMVSVCLQGTKYNIPVQIWLPEGYARQPPIMYVVPTPTMIIKPNHSFVDASGVVLSPYVRNWIPGRYPYPPCLLRIPSVSAEGISCQLLVWLELVHNLLWSAA